MEKDTCVCLCFTKNRPYFEPILAYVGHLYPWTYCDPILTYLYPILVLVPHFGPIFDQLTYFDLILTDFDAIITPRLTYF